jgi:hypothetical protein
MNPTRIHPSPTAPHHRNTPTRSISAVMATIAAIPTFPATSKKAT